MYTRFGDRWTYPPFVSHVFTVLPQHAANFTCNGWFLLMVMDYKVDINSDTTYSHIKCIWNLFGHKSKLVTIETRAIQVK